MARPKISDICFRIAGRMHPPWAQDRDGVTADDRVREIVERYNSGEIDELDLTAAEWPEPRDTTSGFRAPSLSMRVEGLGIPVRRRKSW
jgi:hypothetical protein